jgi:hypothetical protein
LGVVSQTARDTNGRLRVTKLDLSDFQKTSQSAEAGAADGRTSRLSLTGVALDNPAVAELLDGLQDSGLFGRVELLMMKEREDANGGLRDYEVKCEF